MEDCSFGPLVHEGQGELEGARVVFDGVVKDDTLTVVANASDIVPTEDTLGALRTFQQISNGQLKIKRWEPAQVGEVVHLKAVCEIETKEELLECLHHAVSTVIMYYPFLQRLAQGEDVVTVYADLHGIFARNEIQQCLDNDAWFE